jgi:probable H4MPT-linked C1 transfer pathway protein
VTTFDGAGPATAASHIARAPKDAVIGWDIGGVNTKVAAVAGGRVVTARIRPFELQRAPTALAGILRELGAAVGAKNGVHHAVTLTAELSQVFRTKREGVGFVLDSMATAFPTDAIWVFAVDGRFVAPADARLSPMDVAAANWAAAAMVVARRHPNALLVDVGTTTTDIIPIVGGVPVAAERTDPGRLASGELVYTGVLRTPVEAIASRVPFQGRMAGVSAEGFALAGDVHLWRGDLAEADYTCPTPDGRPAGRPFAGERLARVVCADGDVADDEAITAIADAVAGAQVDRIAEAIAGVRARHPALETAVVAGVGAFLGASAARAAGLRVVSLANELGEEGGRSAPAAAVALLFERARAEGRPAIAAGCLTRAGRAGSRLPREAIQSVARTECDLAPVVDLIVKIGGGVLADRGAFDAALDALSEAARERRLLVVPGGGPFADAVRSQDARFRLPDATAHWMAVLGMDQCAHLIAARLPGAVLVTGVSQIAAALTTSAGRVPVLAPYAWLRAEDPVPHSWDVTSDSIAAWIGSRIGARRLVLVKPAGAVPGSDAVDAYFARALPGHLPCAIVAADRIADLRSALRGSHAAD